MKKIAIVEVLINSFLLGCAILRGNKDIKEIRFEFDSIAEINYVKRIPVVFYAKSFDGKRKTLQIEKN